MSWNIDGFGYEDSSQRRAPKRSHSVQEETCESSTNSTVEVEVQLLRGAVAHWDPSSVYTGAMLGSFSRRAELKDSCLTLSGFRKGRTIVIDLFLVKRFSYFEQLKRYLIFDDDNYYLFWVSSPEHVSEFKEAIDMYVMDPESDCGTASVCATDSQSMSSRSAAAYCQSQEPRRKRVKRVVARSDGDDSVEEEAEWDVDNGNDSEENEAEIYESKTEFPKLSDDSLLGFSWKKGAAPWQVPSSRVSIVNPEDSRQLKKVQVEMSGALPKARKMAPFMRRAVKRGKAEGALADDSTQPPADDNTQPPAVDSTQPPADDNTQPPAVDSTQPPAHDSDLEIVDVKKSKKSVDSTMDRRPLDDMSTPHVGIKLTKDRTVVTPESYAAWLKTQWQKYSRNYYGSNIMTQLGEAPDGVTNTHFLDVELRVALTKGQHANGDKHPLTQKKAYDEANLCAPLCDKTTVDMLLPTDKVRVMFEIVSVFVFGFNFSDMLVLFGLHLEFFLSRARCTSVYGQARTIGTNAWREMYEWVLKEFRCPWRTELLTIEEFRTLKMKHVLDNCKHSDDTAATVYSRAKLWSFFSTTDGVLYAQTLFPFEVCAAELRRAGVDAMFVFLLALMCTLRCPLYSWLFFVDNLSPKFRAVGRFFDAMAKNNLLRLVFKRTPLVEIKCLWYFFMMCASDVFGFEALLQTLDTMCLTFDLTDVIFVSLKNKVIGRFECCFGHFCAESSLETLSLRCLPNSVATGDRPAQVYRGCGPPINRGCIWDCGVCKAQLMNTDDVQLHNHEPSGSSALFFHCPEAREEDDYRVCDASVVVMGRVMESDSEAMTYMHEAQDTIKLPDNLDLETRDKLLDTSSTSGFGLKKSQCFNQCAPHVDDFITGNGLEKKGNVSKRERGILHSVIYGRHSFGLFCLNKIKGEWKLYIDWQWRCGPFRVDIHLFFECLTDATKSFHVWFEYNGSLHVDAKRDCSRAFTIAEDFLEKDQKALHIVMHSNMLAEKDGVDCLQTMSQRELVKRISLTLHREFMVYLQNGFQTQMTSIGCKSELCDDFYSELEKMAAKSKFGSDELKLRKVETCLHSVLVTNKKFGFKGKGFAKTPFPVDEVNWFNTDIFCPLPECRRRFSDGYELREHCICGIHRATMRAGTDCSKPEALDLMCARTLGAVTFAEDLEHCEWPPQLGVKPAMKS